MNQHTYEKMMSMRLFGMAETYKDQCHQADISEWGFEERLTLLIDAESDQRLSDKITRLTKNANLSDTQAHVEGIKYYSDRGLNREVFLNLADNKYIFEPKNIVLVGATGSGKSYIACALGNNACQSALKVRYYRLPDLFTELELARAQGTYKKILKQLENCELLILDEWLLIPATSQSQQDLLEILERRYRQHATIFCSQFSIDGWHQRLGSGALADAILDRALAKSKIIPIQGDKSMRSR
ncbi:IS21-like element helper ATPase IstB [Gracilibacillus phocaeensis]|uniref:IS21-like element helper ATPase IstB n=1 Tax=Gracilibacillus phocaeensis TaxID=2042304 RepID=UPI0010324186|nr:IS21-like element helper ATPase IstB [Gracilibacillus phocaeensis]